MATKNRFQDKFSASKVGTGRFYMAGSLTARAPKGLAGGLRRAQGAGKYSYAKNLSKEDLKTFQKMLGEEMSQLSTHSKGLGRKARARIMGQAEKLRQEGKISAADKQDLQQIVKALGANTSKQGVETDIDSAVQTPKQRATSFITDEADKQPPLAKTKKANNYYQEPWGNSHGRLERRFNST